MDNPTRRNFLKTTSAAVAAAAVAKSVNAYPRPRSEKEKWARLASNCYACREVFTRNCFNPGEANAEEGAKKVQKKYGAITLLDFPQFTRDNFEGIYSIDLLAGLFGDINDLSMFKKHTSYWADTSSEVLAFDPSTPSAKKWLDKLADKFVQTGVNGYHLSNDFPQHIADLDDGKRKAGIADAKIWLEAASRIGVKAMRINTAGPHIAPQPEDSTGLPRNDELEKYLEKAILSYRELAEYGEKKDVIVTIENHWGLTANPINSRIIISEVDHPYLEACPDFCNWENKYMLYHALDDIMPYAHTIVHAKYWDRWENLDIERCVKILNKHNFQGKISLEYEQGPWNGIEGTRKLAEAVTAAL